MTRRAPGSLEAEVLGVLWASANPQSADDVRRRLGADLAYTTVATILARLHDKGAVRRQLSGRVYSYSPVLSDADLIARRMHALLEDQADRTGVLARFVEGLDTDTQAALRTVLSRRAKRR